MTHSEHGPRPDHGPPALSIPEEQSDLVVDDGSEDDVAAALAPFSGDSRLNILRVSHGGVSRARNLGVSEGHGDLLAFLDSDDYWLPGKLAAQTHYLADSGQRINQTEEIWIRNGVRVNPPRHAIKQDGDLFFVSLEVIVHHENFRRFHRAPPESRSIGKLNEKTDPCPSWLVTPIVPPCASTIALAMGRPMPVPCTR